LREPSRTFSARHFWLLKTTSSCSCEWLCVRSIVAHGLTPNCTPPNPNPNGRMHSLCHVCRICWVCNAGLLWARPSSLLQSAVGRMQRNIATKSVVSCALLQYRTLAPARRSRTTRNPWIGVHSNFGFCSGWSQSPVSSHSLGGLRVECSVTARRM